LKVAEVLVEALAEVLVVEALAEVLVEVLAGA